MSGIILLTHESSEEEEVKVVMKEEHEMDVAHSWIEVGSASIGRGGSKRVVASGISHCLVLLSLSNYSFTVLWLSLAFVTGPLFSFSQGLGLLRWVSSLWEEAQQLEIEGLQKIQLAVAGLEAEGLYSLLKGAIPYSPMSSIPPPPKRYHHAPTTKISKPPPQELEGVKPKASTPMVKGVELAPEAPSSSVSQALEVAIHTHMVPLHLWVGASKGCTYAGLRGAVRGCQPHMLLSAHTCTETIWG